MPLQRRRALVSAALCALAALTPVVAQVPKGSKNWTPVEENDFVKVKGTRFFSKEGPWFMFGMNYWSCMNLAADDDAGGNYTRFITEMDQMASRGINHLRIMSSSEGAPTIQPFRMYPPLMPAPDKWDEKIFVGLDRCVAEAGKRGMRLTMSLNNEWHWSGGFAQYVSWFNKDEQIPYPPSWDPTANPPWGDYTTNSSWGFEGYANKFYSIPEAQELFKRHIAKVMFRQNTVTKKWYYNDATILAWELANEPQTDGKLIQWAEETSRYIKQNAYNQLVTTGSEGKFGEQAFKEIHSLSSIDFACAHLWVQNWGAYQMTDQSSANLNSAIEYARNFLSSIGEWSVAINKPVVLEEFGFPRDNWLNQGKNQYLYASTATTRNKDTYFDSVLNTIVTSWAEGKGFAGFQPWAYGGIWRPEPRFRNKFNEAWAGDPPHEAPGWYDLYDTDYTMEIIEKYVIFVKTLIGHGIGKK
ncbi:glycoside hydrolase [Exidia glandulosa HHB12029]|uniref:mannan endo-1,4-beta-mannosidase n=1 Tax=Exidia glandulosa HHB12029 TaxID=1314781 RepID=A0A165N965_EXIGL|nr:glycoside hydrolase [Exidia glandulosa HHB12029]